MPSNHPTLKPSNPQTILLTGTAGFIGSSLLEKIIDDYHVIAVDDFNDFYNPAWKQENVEPFLTHKNLTLYKTDITNYQNLEQIFKNHRIDKIVHLAARAGIRPSIQNPIIYQQVNVGGTLNLLEFAKQYQIKHFIYASSSSVYGNQTKIPFSETDEVNQPISPYAATKKAGEMMCYTYAQLYKIKMTCLRFFTVYGPKGRPDMAPYLFTKAILNGDIIKQFGDGSTKRDYTYVDDICEGVAKAIDKQFDYEIINLGNNSPVSLKEFIATIENVSGKQAKIEILPMQPGDVEKTYADVSKAKKMLNWEPKTDLLTGLTQFISWFKTHR
jgi:UDP-glucuronate 4-epimerase